MKPKLYEEVDDHFHDECGVVGVWNHSEAANIAYLCLYAQQHRGQEGAGVVSVDDSFVASRFTAHRGLGLVADIFNRFDFTRLSGRHSIGHVRYSTAGGGELKNIQPFMAEIGSGPVAISHNGNLVNAEALREELIEQGSIFSSTSDTEVFLHLLARAPTRGSVVEGTCSMLSRVEGAFSLLLLMSDRLLAVRDPQGFRPLAIGALGDTIVFASETCAFDLIGATYIRDVEPGELVEVSGNGEIKSYFPFGSVKPAPCIFEYVYFARPDSYVFGKNVYSVRKRLGAELAREYPVEADIVVPVPDSGVPSALGYAEEAKIPFEIGLIRNHYVGRTFIEPKQSIRDFGVKIKLNANTDILAGKRIVVVDDSIVRGTTSRKLVAMFRSAGAREVHLRISAPPTTGPCFYGIDTPDKSELIAARMSLEEIRNFVGADTFAYLSLDGLYRAVRGTPNAERSGFCDACFSGNYPVPIPSKKSSYQHRLFIE